MLSHGATKPTSEHITVGARHSRSTRMLRFLLCIAAFCGLGLLQAHATELNRIQAVDVEGTDTNRTIRISTLTKPTYTVFKLSDPMRVVIDVSGGDVSGLEVPITVEDGLVGQIGSRQFRSNGFFIGRVVIGFTRNVTYTVVGEDNAIVVTCNQVDQSQPAEPITPEIATTKPSEAPEKPVVDTNKAATSAPEKAAKAPVVVAQEQAQPVRSVLLDVVSEGEGPSSVMLLKLDGTPKLEVERIEDPPRLVVDLYDTDRKTNQKKISVDNPYVRQVRLGQHSDKIRAVLDLKHPSINHSVKKTSKGFLITMNKPEPKKPAIPTKVEDNVLTLKDVQFKKTGTTAQIILDVDPDTLPSVDVTSKKAWLITLNNTQLPSHLERSLDTTAYDTVVRLISTYQASTNPPVVKIIANLDGQAGQSLRREKNRLIWEIKDARIARSPARTSAPQTAGFASEAATLAKRTPAAPRTKTKKRISLDLKDADILGVLRFVSDVSGENIVASDEIQGKITVHLRNIPWDQALDTILKTKGLGRVRHNNILRIAPMEDIQRERERELKAQRARLAVEQTAVKIIPVNYAIASEIVNQITPMLTERGTAQTDERTNTIIVEDVVSNIDRLIQLTTKLDRQTPQVLIEARIVEAASNRLKELGIQWGGVGQATTAEGNPTGLQFPGDVIVSGAATDNATTTAGTYSPSRYAINLPAAIGSGSGGGLGFVFGSAGGSQLLALRLTAMEENGTGRIISSPRITTLDNRTARIAQGIDIPISVTSAQGTNTKFVPANLELEVTPHVTNDGSILMKIKTEKNEADFSNTGAAGDPTIMKKFAETEVLVADGNTTVIGGIYTRTISESYAGVPFLSKIPILGWLFKKQRKEDKRAELLIFITPRIVNRDESMVGNSLLAPEAG